MGVQKWTHMVPGRTLKKSCDAREENSMNKGVNEVSTHSF